MPILPSVVLPRRMQHRPPPGIRVAPQLLEAAAGDGEAALRQLQTSPDGLTEQEAGRRLEEHGPNVVAQERRHGQLRLLGHALVNPLVVLLLVLAALSFLTGDARAGVVMLLMVCLGVVLHFVQESRADAAAARLKALIRVTATALRDGRPREVPLGELVPGDVVLLCAGDMVPADVRLLACKDLFLNQASLTGESFPVEKFDAPEPGPAGSPRELKNVASWAPASRAAAARRWSSPPGSTPPSGAWPAPSSGSRPRPASTAASAPSPG
jgi:Mg2+-importing ATPase